MYYLDHRRDVVRIPPERLGAEVDTVLTELAQQQFEGKLVDGQNLAVTIREVKPIGEGHIIHGDGGVYQEVEYRGPPLPTRDPGGRRGGGRRDP